jgi:hypothetical protein
MSCFQQNIWAEVGKLDSMTMDVVFDELLRSAMDSGIGSHRCESVSNIVACLSSISIRGRLFAKLRRVSDQLSLTILS